MEDAQDIQEKKKKRRSLITSLIVHLLLILLGLLPLLTYTDPPPGQEGVQVSFGTVDMGSGDDQPMTQDEEKVEQQQPSEEAAEQAPPTEQEPNEISEKVVTSKKPDAPSIEEKKKQEEEQKKQEEARRKAAEEAHKKAEEARRQKEYEEQKKQFGELFEGSGRGETQTSGNQGDPEGEPNAEKLEGISEGSGMVGGGLGERGVLNEPDISDASQKQGTVVMRVCVNAQGEVTSADYTQRGSTTTDSYLIDKARRSAYEFRFTESDREKQCGTITIVFKLQ